MATRYAIIDQDGYSDGFVNYGSVEQKTLTALAGVKAFYQYSPKMTYLGSLGVEHDLDEDADDLSVSVSGVSGLTHLFFGLSIAQKTYFQKIADPADIASTAAVAFTINHIGAVVLPALLGYIWLYSPAFVFIVASGIAAISLALSFCIPKKPSATNETIFSKQRIKL